MISQIDLIRLVENCDKNPNLEKEKKQTIRSLVRDFFQLELEISSLQDARESYRHFALLDKLDVNAIDDTKIPVDDVLWCRREHLRILKYINELGEKKISIINRFVYILPTLQPRY